MKTLVTMLLVVAFAPTAHADLKKTVDAFAGRWTFDADITVGTNAPAKAKLTNDCKRTAGGRAVVCSMKGKTPMGPMEASFLIGYDEYGKAVHFMAMTSDGEVHDHVCRWKDTTLACDRLKGGMGTTAITEDMWFKLVGGKLAFESIITMEDGTKITFAGNATRK